MVDALLIFSFGGPQGPDDVMPFLRGIVAGRGVPDARLQSVASNYDAVGGVSPINAANEQLVADVQAELDRRGHRTRVYLGNRHWRPFVADAVAAMEVDGVTEAAVFITSAYGSYPGCRAYLDALDGLDTPIAFHPLRRFFNHPGFLEPIVERARAAAEGLEEPRLVFSAHSIPTSMALTSPYEAQLRSACAHVAAALGVPAWDLVWQSRSGPPQVPWLEPDVCDFLAEVDADRPVLLVPIGFVSDHMEVVWDLDTQAAAVARQRGIPMVRPRTPQDHPRFVAMVAELLEELGSDAPPPAVGPLPAAPRTCAPGCCPAPAR